MKLRELINKLEEMSCNGINDNDEVYLSDAEGNYNNLIDDVYFVPEDENCDEDDEDAEYRIVIYSV